MKLSGVVMASLLVLFAVSVGFGFYANSQWNSTQMALSNEKTLSAGMKVALSAIEGNRAYNMTATQRQLARERQLRSEADEKIKTIQRASRNDECANRDMPADIYDSLQ